MGKLYVTWEDVETFIEQICETYRLEDVSGVYGVPRGGLVFAVMLSHKMNIPLLSAAHPNCLVVDDICDSGESLKHYITNSSSPNKPKYYTVTMFCRHGLDNPMHPTIYGTEVDEEWVVFPWEE